MSYDIRICVKIDGLDKYAAIAAPEYDDPTYNLRDMFVACMGWEYEQGVKYPCAKVIEYVNEGIKELRTNREKYVKYNAPNGWGTIVSAIEALESLRDCIYEESEHIPIEHLYMGW